MCCLIRHNKIGTFSIIEISYKIVERQKILLQAATGATAVAVVEAAAVVNVVVVAVIAI